MDVEYAVCEFLKEENWQMTTNMLSKKAYHYKPKDVYIALMNLEKDRLITNDGINITATDMLKERMEK